MYWYKNNNNKEIKFVEDNIVGDNPIEFFKSPDITSWGHKNKDGTIDICFPAIWEEEEIDAE
jgi:hypothetical protein